MPKVESNGVESSPSTGDVVRLAKYLHEKTRQAVYHGTGNKWHELEERKRSMYLLLAEEVLKDPPAELLEAFLKGD